MSICKSIRIEPTDRKKPWFVGVIDQIDRTPTTFGVSIRADRTSGLEEHDVDVPSGTTVRWVDHHGRELPASVSTEDGRHRYTVSFIDPVLPGERLTYKRISETPGLAAKEGDIWAYRADRGSKSHPYRYNETVTLPVGAEFVSAEPEPSRWFISLGGRTVVEYRTDHEADERFTYKIQYRLPNQPSR